MYAIHTTPGFIIDSRPRGEAGKLLSIFTRELGLVLATAEGIRLEKSKLRYHTANYSFGSFSFVRGKEFWRLTSAQKETLSSKLADSSETESFFPLPTNQEFFARLALLLRRLLHGEEPHPELFDVLENCRQFIILNSLNDEQTNTLESITVLRILNSLGYVGNAAEIKEFVGNKSYSLELIEKGTPQRKVLNQHINKALKESQL